MKEEIQKAIVFLSHILEFAGVVNVNGIRPIYIYIDLAFSLILYVLTDNLLLVEKKMTA